MKNRIFNKFNFSRFGKDSFKDLKVIKGEAQAISLMIGILVFQGCVGCGGSSNSSLELEVRELKSEVYSAVRELREIKKTLRRAG